MSVTAVREGTYRSVCGRLLHCRVDAAGRIYWESEDEDGTCRTVDLAATARPVLLSDDPAGRRESVLARSRSSIPTDRWPYRWRQIR